MNQTAQLQSKVLKKLSSQELALKVPEKKPSLNIAKLLL